MFVLFSSSRSKAWTILALVGFISFPFLYFSATLLYPGGSQFNRVAKGFSWLHNYWCNLLNTNSINGAENPARLIAFPAMFLVCFSLGILWWQFFGQSDLPPLRKQFFQASGIMAALTSFFIFTNLHDTVVTISGFFGVIAVSGMQLILYRKRWYFLFGSGIVMLMLILLNNWLYRTGHLYYLPPVQVSTFMAFILWFSLIAFKMIRDSKPAD